MAIGRHEGVVRSRADLPRSLAAFLLIGRAPFVGRDRELAILARQLEESRATRARVVLLAGEAGIGKTRLFEEFPAPPLVAGIALLRAGSSQAQGMPPYLPFLEALGGYVATAQEDTLRADLGAAAASVSRLLPEVSARLGDTHALPSGPPEQERLRYPTPSPRSWGRSPLGEGGALVLVLDQHLTRGLISPGAFIPIAEETGLIVPIGLWVVPKARAWQARFLSSRTAR